ncbi:hypothetical protein G9A89_023601 [Geosiphon pyriformis]|nr:hypothetical protein G9A89_023601 [Geosiphon pyriformis]
MILIKVFVIEATQYQALVGNDWLSKTNAVLDWTMQELQLSQNIVCGHFKPTNSQPLIKLEEETKKPIWKAYQVLWADTIMEKESRKKNISEKPPLALGLMTTKMRKGKEREDNLPEETKSTKDTTSGWTSLYSIHEPLPEPPHILLKCKNCEKKLSTSTDVNYNKLLPILAWDKDNHGKGKQKEEHTWETIIVGKKKERERKEKTTYQRKLNQQKTPPVAGQVCTPSMSHYQNHHTYHSNAKIVGRNSLPWELESHQTKITGCEPTIIASLATANGMAT